jgi:phthalate 4,5-cis-dihydrodiol dehydrogenase
MTFNGYGYFDGTELTWDIGEGGYPQTGARKFPGRPRITGPADPDRKSAVAEQRQGGRKRPAEQRRQPFFGLTVVCCEFGVIRQSPDGLYVYTEKGREEVPCAVGSGREAELRELAEAIAASRPAFPDGRWGKATLEVCLAVTAAARCRPCITRPRRRRIGDACLRQLSLRRALSAAPGRKLSGPFLGLTYV